MATSHPLSRPHPPFGKCTGSNWQMDVMVTVAGDEAVRIQRIMERDGVSEQQVRERMENQWPQEEKFKHSDFVIQNNPGDVLVPQVIALHRVLVGAVILFVEPISRVSGNSLYGISVPITFRLHRSLLEVKMLNFINSALWGPYSFIPHYFISFPLLS